MIELTLVLHPLSPLALHRTRAGLQYTETLDYVPGTVIWGALAETCLAEKGKPDSAFEAVFLSGKVQFGDLLPTLGDKPSELLPATARMCKRDKKHIKSLRDSLLDPLRAREDNGVHICPYDNCREPLDRTSGYLIKTDQATDRFTPPTRLRVNTAIERGTGTVAKEMLFAHHTLVGWRYREKNSERELAKERERVLFSGTVRLSDPSLQTELDHWLAPETRLWLGAGRNRGLGEVKVVKWSTTSDAIPPLSERWRQFNEYAQKAGGKPDRRYFSLLLQSHLALRDELLCPVLHQITPQHLGLPSGVGWTVDANTGMPVRAITSLVIPGWNNALGLPKTDTVVLTRGSVLLGECAPTDEADVLARLEEIEQQGAGERRAEGFGRILACAPFHFNFWSES